MPLFITPPLSTPFPTLLLHPCLLPLLPTAFPNSSPIYTSPFPPSPSSTPPSTWHVWGICFCFGAMETSECALATRTTPALICLPLPLPPMPPTLLSVCLPVHLSLPPSLALTPTHSPAISQLSLSASLAALMSWFFCLSRLAVVVVVAGAIGKLQPGPRWKVYRRRRRRRRRCLAGVSLMLMLMTFLKRHHDCSLWLLLLLLQLLLLLFPHLTGNLINLAARLTSLAHLKRIKCSSNNSSERERCGNVFLISSKLIANTRRNSFFGRFDNLIWYIPKVFSL